jgi:endonuclease YncB( thermonuclease family)
MPRCCVRVSAQPPRQSNALTGINCLSQLTARRPLASGGPSACRKPSGSSPWQASSGTALLSALVLLASPGGASASDVFAGAARVVDGDTLYVQGHKIRLFGLDAPEKAQLCRDARGGDYGCGQTSLEALAGRLQGRPVACSVLSKDLYGRSVASCEVQLPGGREDVGAWLVSNGYAVAYRRVPPWGHLQAGAKGRHLGQGRGRGRGRGRGCTCLAPRACRASPCQLHPPQTAPAAAGFLLF